MIRINYIFIGLALGSLPLSAAVRAPHVDAAIEQAAKSGGDIIVFLRGSDWCGAGESIKKRVWDAPEFPRLLPDKSILVDVDHPEGSAVREIKSMLESSALQAVSVGKIKGERGTKFKILDDGSALVIDTPPPNDTYVVALAPRKTEYSTVVVEALCDDSLPGTGPGRANGNFVLTEVTARYRSATGIEKAVAFDGVWAEREQKNHPVTAVIDGDTGGETGWAVDGGRHHRPVKMLLTTKDPIPARSVLILKLEFLFKSANYTMGRVRCHISGDKTSADVIRALYAKRLLRGRNKALPVKTGNYPAVLVFDAKSELLGAVHGIPFDVQSAALAGEIKDIFSKRDETAQVWVKSQRTRGVEKAKLLGQWLELKGCTSLRFGSKNIHKPVFEELKKADPKDQSHYVRKFGFDAGAIAKEVARIVKEDENSKAIEYLDQEISNPLNTRLSTTQIQNLHLQKHRIYKGWKEQQDKIWDVYKDIVKVDPDTVLGIGAQGKLILKNIEGPPTMRYGWRARHLAPGRQILTMDSGVEIFFTGKGIYQVTLTPTTDGNPLDILSVTLFVDGEKVSRDQHPGELLGKTGNINNAYLLRLGEPASGKKMALQIELDAKQGANFDGKISVISVLSWELHLLSATSPTIEAAEREFTGFTTVTLTPPSIAPQMVYTLDGSDPNVDSPVYSKPLVLRKSTTIKACALIKRGKKSNLGHIAEKRFLKK